MKAVGHLTITTREDIIHFLLDDEPSDLDLPLSLVELSRLNPLLLPEELESLDFPVIQLAYQVFAFYRQQSALYREETKLTPPDAVFLVSSMTKNKAVVQR